MTGTNPYTPYNELCENLARKGLHLTPLETAAFYHGIHLSVRHTDDNDKAMILEFQIWMFTIGITLIQSPDRATMSDDEITEARATII